MIFPLGGVTEVLNGCQTFNASKILFQNFMHAAIILNYKTLQLQFHENVAYQEETKNDKISANIEIKWDKDLSR